MKNEKIIKKIEENLKLGYESKKIVRDHIFIEDEEKIKTAAANLIDVIKNLKRLDYKLHWSFIIGRDLISDHINNEMDDFLAILRDFKDPEYYQVATDQMVSLYEN